MRNTGNYQRNIYFLRNSDVTDNLEKCKFLRKGIKYLVVKITQEGIKTDAEKSMPPPPPP